MKRTRTDPPASATSDRSPTLVYRTAQRSYEGSSPVQKILFCATVLSPCPTCGCPAGVSPFLLFDILARDYTETGFGALFCGVPRSSRYMYNSLSCFARWMYYRSAYHLFLYRYLSSSLLQDVLQAELTCVLHVLEVSAIVRKRKLS